MGHHFVSVLLCKIVTRPETGSSTTIEVTLKPNLVKNFDDHHIHLHPHAMYTECMGVRVRPLAPITGFSIVLAAVTWCTARTRACASAVCCKAARFVVKWCSPCCVRCPLGCWSIASRKSASRSRPGGAPVPIVAGSAWRSSPRSPTRRSADVRAASWSRSLGRRESPARGNRRQTPAVSCCRSVG